MRASLLSLLRDPVTGLELRPDTVTARDEVTDGMLVTEDGSGQYPVRDGIPRFKPPSTYADAFGPRWKRFPRTQLDSHTGRPISAERFWAATGWDPGSLAGSWGLDA
jgi:uncharacterized protein YbaR (Trm112 family)